MKKIFSLLLLSIVLLSSCGKDWLDVNKDPNKTDQASAELVFPSGVVSIAAQVGGWYALAGGFWSQYVSQSNSANQYKFLDQYEVQGDDFNRMWREMYAGGLYDLDYVIKASETSENWTYYLMATVMQAYGFAVMVDLHDKIPYFEAFQGSTLSNYNPVYDDGDVIYADLLTRIDLALSKGQTELTDAQANSDFLFGGDYDSWVQFANTLKLKMYLRMVYADPTTAQSGIEALYTSGAEFLSQNAGLDIFVNQEGKDNPLYASNIRKLNVGTNMRVSSTIYRFYMNNTDPRIASVVSDMNKVNPMPQGGFNIPTPQLDPSTVCVYKQSATDPVWFISEVESYLLQAEAIARGFGSGDDKAYYDAAILADFARKGFDGSSFIASGGVYEYPDGGTLDQKLEAICMAKWAAFAGTSQMLEAFFETNRLGYPIVGTEPAWVNGAYNPLYVPGTFMYSLEGTTSGAFPKRMIYPDDEINLNANAPAQTEVTDKVWWDKR